MLARLILASPFARVLLHPRSTLTAGLVALASFCTLVASIATPLHQAPIVGPHADTIVGTAMVVGPVALWVATYGRSPAHAVDFAPGGDQK